MTDSHVAKPRPYQEVGAAWLREKESALLADPPGLGKSQQLIRAAVGRTLVVAPAMLIQSGMWENEIEKWAPGQLDRFTLVSYSSLWDRKTGGVKRELVEKQWGTLICDEAHYLKNVGSQRYKAVKAIRAVSDRCYLATGTPIPNWPHETFALFTLLFPEKSRPGGEYGSKWRWISTWFRTTANPHNRNALDVGGLIGCTHSAIAWSDPCDCYQRFAKANFRDRFLTRRLEDVGNDLPELIEQTVPVKMTPKQWRGYREMKESRYTQVTGTELVAWSSGSAYVQADRMMTGLMLAEGVCSDEDSGKLAQLREDLENRGAPTLVMAHYRISAQAAEKVAQDMGLAVARLDGGSTPAEKRRVTEAFQAGRLDVLVGTLEVLAEGLTLTRADMVIFLEQSWKPSRNEQAKKRIHRIGQTRTCYIRDYVAVGPNGQTTLDGNKRTVLKEKTDSQIRTLSAAQFVSML